MWAQGTIWMAGGKVGYDYWAKHYEEGSHFGIDGGKISKLLIRKHGESRDLYNYDRGLDQAPVNKEVEAVLRTILTKYN